MKKCKWILTALIVFVGGSSLALAATATNNLGVSANVASACHISSVTDISFGAYDPTSGTPLDAAGNMVFRCIKNTSYKAYITGTRTLSGGTDSLSFDLYSDSGHSAAFPADNSGGGTTAPSLSPITKDIYGRIPISQDVGAASYSATLVATVEY
jgi:spore coat protein U-like protein